MERLLGKLQSYTDLLIHMVETCLKNMFKKGVCKRREIFTYTQINTCLHFNCEKTQQKKNHAVLNNLQAVDMYFMMYLFFQ